MIRYEKGKRVLGSLWWVSAWSTLAKGKAIAEHQRLDWFWKGFCNPNISKIFTCTNFSPSWPAWCPTAQNALTEEQQSHKRLIYEQVWVLHRRWRSSFCTCRVCSRNTSLPAKELGSGILLNNETLVLASAWTKACRKLYITFQMSHVFLNLCCSYIIWTVKPPLRNITAFESCVSDGPNSQCKCNWCESALFISW